MYRVNRASSKSNERSVSRSGIMRAVRGDYGV
jgi:hypothetical protein